MFYILKPRTIIHILSVYMLLVNKVIHKQLYLYIIKLKNYLFIYIYSQIARSFKKMEIKKQHDFSGQQLFSSLQ